ncbi:phage tail assembly chaperone [Anaerosporobacter sp.]
MSNLSRFLKKNKIVKENVKFAATKSLVDENGNALEWEFRTITTAQDETIRDECTTEMQVKGKPGLYRPKLDTRKYLAKMVCACCVDPCLDNAELQDSYGVKKPEDLLTAIVDNPGEYQDLILFVQKNNGFDTNVEDKIEEAKN